MNRSNGLSLAIGADAVVAVRGEEFVTVPRVTADGPMSIADTFAQVSRLLNDGSASTRGAARTTIDVALMPSVCEARLVLLPPLRTAEAEAVIRRDANKHFTMSNEARVIGVRVPGRTNATQSAPVMAAAVSQRLMDEIALSAQQNGWVVRRITPAHAAWLASINSSRDASGRPRAVIAVEKDTAHVMRVEGSAPVELRRIAAGHTEAIANALGSSAGTATLMAPEGTRGALNAALGSRGWSVLPVNNAAVVAAKNAAASDLVLLSDADYARRAVAQRTLANRLAAAAVFLVLGAAIVAHWGAKRELDTIHARRVAIRNRVQPLLALRDSVDQLEAKTKEATSIFNSQAHWSRTLYEITMLLPTDAHLTRLNATGDTIVIEGEAERAGDVLEAIGRAPTLRNVQLQGPVQRDLADGATTSERFVIEGTLASAQKKVDPKAKRHVAPGRTAAKTDSLGGFQ